MRTHEYQKKENICHNVGKKLLSPFKNFEMFSILKLLFPFKYVETFSFLRLPWEKFFSETISLIFFG